MKTSWYNSRITAVLGYGNWVDKHHWDTITVRNQCLPFCCVDSNYKLIHSLNTFLSDRFTLAI